jgi:hypothetical protein
LEQADHYAMLEQGARHLAAISADPEERRLHLGWANRYYKLGVEARLEPTGPVTARAA